MGPICCPETSVKDYHSTLHNTPEEHRFQHARCPAHIIFSSREISQGNMLKVTAEILNYLLLIANIHW
jgi:hypothetical protein